MLRRSTVAFLFTATAALLLAESTSAEVTAKQEGDKVVVQVDGQPFTEYLTANGTKPILWPILGPTGKPVTRNYPMKKVEGEKADHPHHRSMWFTHGNVNGIDFWAEKPGTTGTIKHREFVRIAGGPTATIVTRNDWLAPNGKRQCEDERTFRFGGDGDARWIDFDVTVMASDGPVKFGDTKEGAMGLRVAEPIRVEAKKGGRIVNSAGLTNAAAWGKPAAWVDYQGPIDGQTVGIAIMNHPRSFRFPTCWHVRTYGLFAANPFGLAEFTGKKLEDGSVTLKKGQTLTLRYRVYLHRGDEKAGKVAEAFAAYAKTP